MLGKRFERDWFGQDLEIGSDLYHLLHERGVDLGFRAVVVFMKLDLGELSHLGFPTVSSKFCPCPFCKCTKSNMHSTMASRRKTSLGRSECPRVTRPNALHAKSLW